MVFKVVYLLLDSLTTAAILRGFLRLFHVGIYGSERNGSRLRALKRNSLEIFRYFDLVFKIVSNSHLFASESLQFGF